MNGMVTLEPGDALCYHAKVCCVLAVTDDEAVLGDVDGNEYKESRRVNEFFFDFTECGKPGCTVHQRYDAAQRAAFLKKFLETRQPPRPAGPTTKPSGEQETEEVMAKKAKTKKTTTTETTKGPRIGGLGELMGCSVASVVRRLGKEGVKGGHAMAILEAQKIKASKPGVATMLFNGRHGIGGEVAPLTAAQVSELVKSAEAPARANAKAAE